MQRTVGSARLGLSEHRRNERNTLGGRPVGNGAARRRHALGDAGANRDFFSIIFDKAVDPRYHPLVQTVWPCGGSRAVSPSEQRRPALGPRCSELRRKGPQAVFRGAGSLPPATSTTATTGTVTLKGPCRGRTEHVWHADLSSFRLRALSAGRPAGAPHRVGPSLPFPGRRPSPERGDSVHHERGGLRRDFG